MSSRFYDAGSDSDSDSASDSDESLDLKKKPTSTAKTTGTAAPAGRSKFLKKDDSDESTEESSEEDDDDDEEDSDEELSDDEGGVKKPGDGKVSRKARFMKGAAETDSDEDEDEDDQKRVVRSARDKRFEDMRSTVKLLKNGIKINDWIAISNEFDKLNKLHSKLSAIVQKEGNPRFYIRSLVRIEDLIKRMSAEENKDKLKKMNPSTAKAFSTMKQKIKKHNKLFETDINKLRETFVDTDVSEDEAEAAAEAAAAALAAEEAKTKPKGRNAFLKGGASDEESSDQDDDFESGSDDEEDGAAGTLKTEDGADGEKSEKRIRKPKKVKLADGEDGEEINDFTIVGKGGKVPKLFEVTIETLFKKLRELLEARGKKSTDKGVQVTNLKRLQEVANTPHAKIRVLLALIPAQFDYTPTALGYMNVDAWRNTLANIAQLLTLLEENPHISVVEDVEGDDDEAETEKKAKAGEQVRLRGSVASFVDRLDDEFTKSLQNIDPHTTEYVDRLRDETSLYGLIARTQRHFARLRQSDYEAQIIMRRVEHLYYKPDSVIQTVEEAARKLYPILASDPTPASVIPYFCAILYKTSSDRIRTRALLCHVYHHALHDRFYKARDLLLMSHLQDTIQHTDISTQILFNRTMVQIGLSAFRCGLFKEAHMALQDVQSTGKTKELLAQGIQMLKYSEKTPEQEKLEKSRQLPFHMHINLELLECVYLTCSMLLEIPNMAMTAQDMKRKVISKQFRRMLDYNERQVFTGPPENTRDHIMASAKALANGDWQKCTELISSIKIWDLMPNSASIKEMLGRKIQEEGLRTYFFTYASYYDSIGLSDLASMFDLPIPTVYSIVSKMIINEELNASLDQVTNTVILHRPPGQLGELTRLQLLSGVYADKVGNFVESNERLLDARAAMLGLAQRDGPREGGGRDRRDRGERGAGGEEGEGAAAGGGGQRRGGDDRGGGQRDSRSGGGRGGSRGGRGGAVGSYRGSKRS
ncbi:hypothetical protein SmJEL517_g05301 [Synchytrium microbalum]|uniref:Eukaryotic translation initiation factor 3 subunit C n=1 Tax=Synchytrium microbalum TaxID=1806994 RepID=A0A507BM11_9FUNG|nr:uncharacterized protein SmJEL517_g05301 [Synchytrium microbalum]TPX31340.1 hypothetical protein SmJEL517_g05301 [Synchytrium microbalum]